MLNITQLQTLKAFIIQDPVLSLKPNNSDGHFDIAVELNKVASPDFFVWATNANTQSIYDSIVWANLTPSQAQDGTQAWANKALLCQGKQFNIQTLLQGRETLNAANTNVRAGLQDALTAIPSKSDGTNQSAGWANVHLAMQRKATVIEKIFAVGTGSSASPAIMQVEGQISTIDVEAARNS